MDIMVSVYCLVYNHEKYLRKTLDGFVCQKTSFSYEVIIHDDASTAKNIQDYLSQSFKKKTNIQKVEAFFQNILSLYVEGNMLQFVKGMIVGVMIKNFRCKWNIWNLTLIVVCVSMIHN